MLKALIQDSAAYAIPAFISRGLSFFLVPLYTRVLSPADYGSLDLLMVFASIVNVTIALEVSQGVARFYAGESDPDRKVTYASSAFWFSVGCYTLFGVIALTFSTKLSVWVMGREGLGTAFQIGLLYIWTNAIFCCVQNQFRWELRSKHYAVASLLMTFVTAAGALWLTYILGWKLEGLLWGMVYGSALGVVYGLWHLRRSFRWRFDTTSLREMLTFSAPLVLSGISVIIASYIDRLMINYYLTIDDVGLYGIGFRLASIVGLVMVGFQGALTPLIYTYYREADTPQQLAFIFRVFMAFALLVFSGITLFSYEILALIATPAYYGGAAVVIYLVPATLLAQMYIFAPGIDIAKKTYLILWINFGGAILNTAFNWMLIPQMGIAGAGLATMLGYLGVFSAYMILSQRLYYVPHQWARLGAATLITAVVTVAAGNLVEVSPLRLALNVLAICASAAAIVLLGLIRTEELSKVRQILRGRLTSATAAGKG
jgi:O-antigen/teichoic acid export membrane protein